MDTTTLLTLILPLSLIVIGISIVKLLRIRFNDLCELLVFSYTMSMAIVFGMLYLGCICNVFQYVSFMILGITIASIIYLSSFILRHTSIVLESFRSLTREHLILIGLIIGLLSISAIFYSSRAILDSDVTQQYLPLARQIVKTDGFTYNNGYDFNIQLKPIGASVLYGWTYAIGGSTSIEAFRLLPLVPLLILIMLVYLIASFVTKSKIIGLVSAAIFIVFPFNDRFLLYNAFYPDAFFYPLIISAIYFLLRFFESRDRTLLIWAGCGLGVAGLLKAQTIYVLIAFFVIITLIELHQHKKLTSIVCVLIPFYILMPSILADSIQGSGFRIHLPNLSEIQWLLLISLSLIIAISLQLIYRKTQSVSKFKTGIKVYIKNIALILIPFGAFSSLWYIYNFLKYGTLIWTSSINLPNYSWALSVVRSSVTVQPVINVSSFVSYFSLMFADPAVMGYVFLVPSLMGFLLLLKTSNKITFRYLALFEIFLGVVILSEVILSLSSQSGYNPRDIFLLSPVLATLCGFGIVSTVSNIRKSQRDYFTIITSFLLVAFFGLLSYIHSVLIAISNLSQKTLTLSLIDNLGKIVGLSLTQTSMQLPYVERANFVGNNLPNILLLSLISAIPFFLLLILNFNKINLAKKIQKFNKRRINYAEVVLIMGIMLYIIIIPRADIFFAQGGFAQIENNQIKQTYGDLYNLIAEFRNNTLTGGILTYSMLDGLPYYLPDTKFIDLNYPSNLGQLKDCLLQNSGNETVNQLKQLGIQYLLINPSNIMNLDRNLNSSLSKIIENPELSKFTQKFGNWVLYTLGPYHFKTTLIPLSEWSETPELTTASYYLNSNSSEISLTLNASNVDSRVTIYNSKLPELNMSEYDMVRIHVTGSSNAKILIRFFLNNGVSFDLCYWSSPNVLANSLFDLSSYNLTNLRGDAYISIMSSNSSPASISITGIEFTKIL